MNARLVVIAAVAAVALGGGGFVAGMTAARAGLGASQPSGGPAGLVQRLGPGGGGQAGGSQLLVGRVLSVNDGSVTVEVTQAGGETRSVIALAGDSTRVVRTAETEIELSDIKPGDQVVVAGQSDQAAGTVSATTISLGGSGLPFGGRPGGQRGASPSPGTP